MWLRGHISVFALGCVVLLVINLIRGSGGIWADTAIGAWAILLVVHGLILVIARLLQELLAEEEEAPIRPASEIRWDAPSTWTLPQRASERKEPRPSRPAPVPATPVLDPQESAAAAAARDRKPRPAQPTPPETAAPETDDAERVSWQAATDAAWLAPREPGRPPARPEKPDEKPDDEDDFTPLKFD